ncbi:hypothetical protein K438DRAFT_1806029, partial [Mycena galopus ATCC 62051]
MESGLLSPLVLYQLSNALASDREARRCLVCKGDTADELKNYLLTCQVCKRSWHHRCREPKIPDPEMVTLLREYLHSGAQGLVKWTCAKCSRKATTVTPVQPLPTVSNPTNLELASSTRHATETRSNRASMAVIDLTDGNHDIDSHIPSPLRSERLASRVQPSSRAQVADGIIISRQKSHPLPEHSWRGFPLRPYFSTERPARVSSRAQANTEAFIDLSDSPPHVDGAQPRSRSSSMGQTPPPDTPTPANRDARRPRSHTSASPSLSELFRPDTPTPATTRLSSMDTDMNIGDEDEVDQKPLLWELNSNADDDEPEQKPLALLLQHLTVSDRPRGGTLGPTWMHARAEANGEMAKWARMVERQKMPKPLSRRKPGPGKT